MAGEPVHVIFGWGAPPMAEQFPSLTPQQADKFDALSKAIIMCHLHGLLPDSVRDSAIKKCTRQIKVALAHRPTLDGRAAGAPSSPSAADTGGA